VISDYEAAVITSDQRLRGKADPHVRAVVRSFVRLDDPLPSRQTNERTNQCGKNEKATVNSQQLTSNGQRTNPCNPATLHLLCSPEVGLSEVDAQRLAEGHAYEWLERQTFAWLNERKQGRVETTGALFSRIRQRFSAPELSSTDKASALYQRLHPNCYEEALQERRNKYIPEQYKDIILH
jgi:hypothetical protein